MNLFVSSLLALFGECMGELGLLLWGRRGQPCLHGLSSDSPWSAAWGQCRNTCAVCLDTCHLRPGTQCGHLESGQVSLCNGQGCHVSLDPKLDRTTTVPSSYFLKLGYYNAVLCIGIWQIPDSELSRRVCLILFLDFILVLLANSL